MKIIMIDDDPNKIRTMTYALMDAGLKSEIEKNPIETFSNASDGTAAILEGNFDLLILDMYFPIRRGESVNRDSGTLVLHQLELKDVEIPTIIYSSVYNTKVRDYKNFKHYILADTNHSLSEMLKGILVDLKFVA